MLMPNHDSPGRSSTTTPTVICQYELGDLLTIENPIG